MPEGRPLSRLAAGFGNVRVLMGTGWLDAYIRLNRRREPAALLASTWSAACRLGVLFGGGALYRNRFGYDWRSILFLRVLKRLDRAGIRCLPKVSLSNFEAVRAVTDGGRPIIAVMAHSPADAVINRVFAEAKIPWTLLAASLKGVAPKARQLGLRGELDVIPRNNDALLAIRQRLGAGRSICACIDFVDKAGSTAGCIFVSPILFELAKLTRSRMIYADASVTRDGTIELVFATPRVDLAASPAEACAEDFIDWLRAERGDRRQFKVRKWTNPASAGQGPR